MTIKPWAWWFLLGSILLLVGSLLIVNLQPGWLGSVQLNPLVQRELPEPWQVSDPWRHVVFPLALALGLSLAVPTLPRRAWSQALVLTLLLAVGIRYFLWRSTTINTAHPISLLFSLTLFLCELVYLVTTTVQLYPAIFFDPVRRRRQADRLAGWAAEQAPSVDIWIPTYNEPARMVRRCILACKGIDHPTKTITVLDDGHRPVIAELARELGVDYLSRPDNSHRKAGNLNYALARTQGDMIAIFDCDFVPFKHFLRRTLGFFSDPNVALVQTPQHYFNSDSHSRNLGLESVMPDDMDYFFHYLQVIRDRFNAVICCGTSYVVRRSALEAIGGYVTSCIIEDHQTGTRLLTQGWRMIYLDEILSLGEVPRSFADYLDQRLRWMQGNFQIYYRGREMPIWSTLNLWQKSFYFNLLISLFTPFFRLVYILFPLASLVFGFTLIAAPPIEYLAYGLPFILLLYTLPSWLTNYHHFQFWNEVYESLFCFPAINRILSILRRPFAVLGSIVTNKEVSSRGGRLDLRIAWPFLSYLTVLLGMLLVLYGAPLLNPAWGRYRFEGESLMLAWNLYNAWVMLTCVLACIDRPMQRGADRFPLEQIARLELGGTDAWGLTTDISEQGTCLRLRPGSSAPRGGEATEGRLDLVEAGLALPVQLAAPGSAGSAPALRLRFGALTQAQEAGLIDLIYNGSAWYQKPRRLGTVDALLILIGSVWGIVPARLAPQGPGGNAARRR